VTPWLPRTLAWTAVVAGPGSVVVSGLLLAMNRPAFRHGPGLPTAGTPEAWGVLVVAYNVRIALPLLAWSLLV
jgi:hypothetical protein